MSELEDKLNTLLSDPDAMAQVMQLAQSLSSTQSAGAGGTPSPPPPDTADEAVGGIPSAGEIGAMLSQLTGGLDPQLLARLLPVLRQMDRPESSETAALLYALRPFLREKRRDKVARAAQLAKLIHLAKLFLTTQEE